MKQNSWETLFSWLKETGYKPGDIGDIVMSRMLMDMAMAQRAEANGMNTMPGRDSKTLEARVSKLEKAAF